MRFSKKKIVNSLTSLAALAAIGGSTPAFSAGLYVFVDEQGVPHYALEQLTDKYRVFESDAPTLSDDVSVVIPEIKMQAKLPDMSKYAVKSTYKVNAYPMSLPNGIKIPQPSQAVLNKLLRNSSLARYEPIIHRHARAAGIDPNLVKSIMAAESGFNPSAVSPKNAQGLMQVIPPTGARYGVSAPQLMVPERNIYAGVRYLADLSRMFKGRTDLIIAAYNAGEGAVYKYNRQIPPYKETQNYVRTVLLYYSVYRPVAQNSTSNNEALAPAATANTLSNRRSAQRISAKVQTQLVQPIAFQ